MSQDCLIGYWLTKQYEWVYDLSDSDLPVTWEEAQRELTACGMDGDICVHGNKKS